VPRECGEEASSSLLRVGSVPSQNFFSFLSRNSVICCILRRFKVYIPIFACHFSVCNGDLLWLEDDLKAQMKFVLVHGLDRMVTSRLSYSCGYWLISSVHKAKIIQCNAHVYGL